MLFVGKGKAPRTDVTKKVIGTMIGKGALAKAGLLPTFF